MVLSNWASSRQRLILDSPIFRNINLIQFEDRKLAPNRTTFPSTYVGTPCPIVTNRKTSDFVMVGSLWKNALPKKRKRFQPRRDVCSWLQRSNRYNVSICGEGDQCPALAESRYGFHVRGDTLGAKRLIDTLLSGTVPIFTDPRQFSILPDWIDWELLSVKVNTTSPTEFQQGLDQLLNTTNYSEKRKHVLANRDLLDWWTGVPFDVYMYMIQRELLPDHADLLVNPYNFSALKIEEKPRAS